MSDDWRRKTLPDGRHVEYVDAVPVEQTDAGLVCDVTVTVDGAVSAPIRVVVPLPGPSDVR